MDSEVRNLSLMASEVWPARDGGKRPVAEQAL